MEDNKDYILNIRVSKQTYDKLKNKAKENSESLSNLVRKSLEDSWEIFGDLKRDIFGEETAKGVEYYQKVVVAKEGVSCVHCGTAIAKGDNAVIGKTKSDSIKYFCENCFSSNN